MIEHPFTGLSVAIIFMTVLAWFGMWGMPIKHNNINNHADIHHVTRSGRRMGHDYTIPLCPWCHRAVPDGNLSPKEMEGRIGPSLARNKRRFVEVYGTELELLERVENLREKHGTH